MRIAYKKENIKSTFLHFKPQLSASVRDKLKSTSVSKLLHSSEGICCSSENVFNHLSQSTK